MKIFNKIVSKEDLFDCIFRNFLVIAGAGMLALATCLFLTNLQIVSGGLSGIAIIIQSYTDVEIFDFIVSGGTLLFWVVGVLALGKKFIVKTTIASLAYSAFIFIFNRVPYFVNLSEIIAGVGTAGEGSVGNILLCAMFYGIFGGAGIALTFLGGGSTGGLDVLIFLFSRATRIKQSVISFALDGIIVLASMFLIKDNVVSSLCGILAAFILAIMIEYIYVGNQTSYTADIISDKMEEISRYAQDVLGRGATLIPVFGGYKKEPRTILRVVIEKRQYDPFRKAIAHIDPKAFVTFTPTIAVYGEGFIKHK